MPKKQTFNQILVVGKGRDIRCFSNSDWFPLKPLNEARKIGYGYWEFYDVSFAYRDDRLGVNLALLLILMDPCFALGGVSGTVFPLCTFLFVKSVFCMVDLPISKELVFSCNRVCYSWALEKFIEFAVRNNLTLENPIKSKALLATERYRFRPRESLLKVYVFEVARHKSILNRVAVVIKTLHRVFAPFFVEPLSLHENGRIKLDQRNSYAWPHRLEFRLSSFRPLRVRKSRRLWIFCLLSKHKVPCNCSCVALCIILTRKPDSCILATESLFRSKLVFVLLLKL